MGLNVSNPLINKVTNSIIKKIALVMVTFWTIDPKKFIYEQIFRLNNKAKYAYNISKKITNRIF